MIFNTINFVIKTDISNYSKALLNFDKYKEAKYALFAKGFWHEWGIEVVSRTICDRWVFPAVSSAYQTMGRLSCEIVTLLCGQETGGRLKQAWTDPFSTRILLATVHKLQRIIRPIAALQPLTLPVIGPVTQSMIGLARFTNMVLTDLDTVLGIANRATKLFSNRPWEAFFTKKQTFLDNAVVAIAFSLFIPIWIAVKIMHFSIDCCKKAMRRIGLHDTLTRPIEAGHRAIKGVFERFVDRKEARVRRKSVAKLGACMMKTGLYIVISSVARSVLARTIIFAGARLMHAYGWNHRFLGKYNPAYHLTRKMLFLINLVIQGYACGAVCREFANDADRRAQNRTSMYKTNIVKAFFHLSKNLRIKRGPFNREVRQIHSN